MKFDQDDLKSFLQSSQSAELLCPACRKAATEKERDLLQRLQGSNKRRCKCPEAMNNIHKDNCFMSWQGVGPRPFYGSDVLKRCEAEWLEKRNQLKKRRKG